MEIDSRYILLLAIYHLIFWWKFYTKPFIQHTSEMASTFFPYWRAGKVDGYYKYPYCIPFLSSFYPVQIVTSWIGRKLSLDSSFVLLNVSVLLHYLLGSILAFYMFRQWASPEVALFGAIVLTYNGCSVKVQQPTIAYTLAWIPGVFIGGWVSVLSTVMVLLAGYYPVAVYVLPLAIPFYWKEMSVGLLIGSIQWVPFLWYYKKSVRWREQLDSRYGRVPVLKLADFFLPVLKHNHTNDTFFMEMAMYVGLIPLLFIWQSTSRIWVGLAFGVAVLIGLIPSVQRIPARALYMVTFCIVWMACNGMSSLLNSQVLALTLIQAYLLLRNSDIYPSFPFTQWWTKPSEKLQDITGYLNGDKKEYHGAFSLR